MREKFRKFLSILLILSIWGSIFEPLAITGVYAASKETSYVYLSSVDETTSSVGYSVLKKNENDGGDMISLLVNGRKMYSMNAIYAHAPSTIIYDLSKYTKFDTFSSYVGVDSSRGSAGDGVKFSVLATKDSNYNTSNWQELSKTKVLKGDTNAEKIDVEVKGYHYLKLVANQNNNNASDHAVYFDAMLYDKANFSLEDSASVDFIKPVDYYDDKFKDLTDDEIVEKHELELLQRTLVDRVGYSILQAIAASNEDKKAMLKWLFEDKKILKKYLTGGEPLGPYMKSFNVLSDLYKANKADLTGPHGDTYLTMMLAISLTHSKDIYFWVTGSKGEKVLSNPMNRYKVFKDLYEKGLKGEVTFENDIFESLTVEEMRWVVDTQLSDEEIPWLNWYSSRTQPLIDNKDHNPKGETKYSNRSTAHSSTNPYTYIAYSKGWNYYDKEYYTKNSTHCGMTYANKNESGYTRGLDCNQEYGLDKWGVGTDSVSKPRLWIVMEEDGVCGALSKTGANLLAVYGRPTAVIGQPGHAAYMVPNFKEENGDYRIEWGIGNAAAGWARSEKGERFLLDWGSKLGRKRARYNMAYIILGQRALDHFDEYEKAFLYNQVANVRTSVDKKKASYENAINVQKYNFDAWYELIQLYLNDDNTTEQQYLDLAKRITEDFFEFPLPMNDLLLLFQDKIVSHQTAYGKLVKETLEKQKNVKDGDYLQANVIRDIAKGMDNNLMTGDIAEFSFDGEDAGKLKLVGKAAEMKMPFEYTLDYEYNNETKKIKSDGWVQVSGGITEVDLKDKIGEMSTDAGIVVHITSTERAVENLFFIDLEEGHHSTKLFANNLERKVAGLEKNAEWLMAKDLTDAVMKMMQADYDDGSWEDFDWKRFDEELPPVTDGETYVFVRNGYTGKYLPSDPVLMTFKPKSDSHEFSYVPVSQLNVSTSSSSVEGAEKTLIDMNELTFWSSAKGDEEKYIEYQSTVPIQLSKIEYVPRQDGQTLGNITEAKIETSMDGETWKTVASDLTWKSDKNTKSYTLDKPTRAKYVKITSLDNNSSVNAAMFNLYQNLSATTKDVSELHVSYITEGYVYSGHKIEPHLTVKDGDKELIKGTHYNVTYKNNINAGTATIQITGIGDYEGTIEKHFVIAKAKPSTSLLAEGLCADASKQKLSDLVLPTGWVWKEPDTVLKPGTTTLAVAVYKDTDNYEYTEFEIKVIKEKGNHPVITIDGDKTYEFTINGKEQKTLDDFLKAVSITDKEDGEISLDADNVEIVSDIDWTEVGTYHIRIKVTDKDGNETTAAIQVQIVNEDDEEIELNEEEYEVTVQNSKLYYTGNNHDISVKVTKKPKVTKARSIILNSPTVHELTPGVDYTVKFSELKKAGEHTVTITGKGIYYGELTAKYTINKAPKPTNMIHPEMHVSSDTTSLDQIELSELWQWADKNVTLQPGENKVRIIFAGDENHERYETYVLVVREKVETPTPSPTPSTTPSTKPSTSTPSSKPTPTPNPNPTKDKDTEDKDDKKKTNTKVGQNTNKASINKIVTNKAVNSKSEENNSNIETNQEESTNTYIPTTTTDSTKEETKAETKNEEVIKEEKNINPFIVFVGVLLSGLLIIFVFNKIRNY